MSEPRHWGSWKGRVIKAIAIDNAFTWDEIRDSTGLSPKSLNQVLAELFDSKTLSKNDKGEYRVKKELYKEYNAYMKTAEVSYGGDKKSGGKRSGLLGKVDSCIHQKTERISKDQQNNIIKKTEEWMRLYGLGKSLKSDHFYIDGDHLDALSKYLIDHSSKEVLMVNPFVERCNLTESLMHAQRDGKRVLLVTRPPKKNSKNTEKRDYHKIIGKSGINLTYNKIVHAKLIVLDRAIAIVSSMNLYSGSTAGASWEAGIISIENTVVESVMDSIFGLLEKPESVSM